MSDLVLPWYAPDVGIPEVDHLFSELALQKLCRKLGSAKQVDIAALQADLRMLAQQFLVVVATSPQGLKGGPPRATLDQRTRWLMAKVINPASRLLKALSDEPYMIAQWPEELDGTAPDKAALLEQLSRLLSHAHQVAASHSDRMRDGNETLTTMKAELGAALTEIYARHFPDLRPAPEYGDRSGDSTLQSPFSIFISACTREIFGDELVIPVKLLEDMGKLQGEE